LRGSSLLRVGALLSGFMFSGLSRTWFSFLKSLITAPLSQGPLLPSRLLLPPGSTFEALSLAVPQIRQHFPFSRVVFPQHPSPSSSCFRPFQLSFGPSVVRPPDSVFNKCRSRAPVSPCVLGFWPPRLFFFFPRCRAALDSKAPLERDPRMDSRSCSRPSPSSSSGFSALMPHQII